MRMYQPGKVANPARGQLNRENEYLPCPRSCLRIWSRETGSTVPPRVSLLISILRLNLVLVICVVDDSHIQHDVLATEETTVTQQVSHRPIKCQSRLWSQKGTKVNESRRGDKTRYSDQQGSKSRQKVMRLCKQWHRPISKRFIKPPYSISRAASIDSDCCHIEFHIIYCTSRPKRAPFLMFCSPVHNCYCGLVLCRFLPIFPLNLFSPVVNVYQTVGRGV